MHTHPGRIQELKCINPLAENFSDDIDVQLDQLESEDTLIIILPHVYLADHLLIKFGLDTELPVRSVCVFKRVFESLAHRWVIQQLGHKPRRVVPIHADGTVPHAVINGLRAAQRANREMKAQQELEIQKKRTANRKRADHILKAKLKALDDELDAYRAQDPRLQAKISDQVDPSIDLDPRDQLD